MTGPAGSCSARAHANFYDAARLGLEAELTWLSPDGEPQRGRRRPELVPRLLPTAAAGLSRPGSTPHEADRLLG
jgi:hypothetical protein